MDLIRSELRSQARLREIERQLSSMHFRVTAFHWFVAPVMVLMVAYVAYFVVSRDLGMTANVVTGVVGLASALAGVVTGHRSLRERIEDLEEERLELESGVRPRPPGV